jgi:predicted NAD/FAD-dependent oxidoreductase
MFCVNRFQNKMHTKQKKSGERTQANRVAVQSPTPPTTDLLTLCLFES